jgi:uncharacterized protein YutE (UPF0331/DUF86 family)
LKGDSNLLDKNLILRKITELEEYKSQLDEYKNITVTHYQNDWKTQRIIERTLQLMIEVCVDISHHILADRKWRIPTSYADTFSVLFEQGLVEKKLCETLQDMVKFRNILVHNYEKVDPEIVTGLLKNNLNDFLLFRDAILKIIQSE